jgi:glycerol uptake operon antiterminator
MSFYGQQMIPAIRNQKQLEKFIQSPFQYGVLLDVHIGQLKNVMNLTKKNNKKLLIHADLIQGLKNDDFSTEYLCQEFKPFGIISTRMNVIIKAKKMGVLAILRVFLIDSHSLVKIYSILAKNYPDFIEVLPGTLSNMIQEVSNEVDIPILAGGFIRTVEDVENSLNAGAIAVTTSNVELWNTFSSLSEYNKTAEGYL